jgi:hypothetical protein
VDLDLAADQPQLDATREGRQLAARVVLLVDVDVPEDLARPRQDRLPVLEVGVGQLARVAVLEGRLQLLEGVVERLARVTPDEVDVVAHPGRN